MFYILLYAVLAVVSVVLLLFCVKFSKFRRKSNNRDRDDANEMVANDDNNCPAKDHPHTNRRAECLTSETDKCEEVMTPLLEKHTTCVVENPTIATTQNVPIIDRGHHSNTHEDEQEGDKVPIEISGNLDSLKFIDDGSDLNSGSNFDRGSIDVIKAIGENQLELKQQEDDNTDVMTDGINIKQDESLAVEITVPSGLESDDIGSNNKAECSGNISEEESDLISETGPHNVNTEENPNASDDESQTEVNTTFTEVISLSNIQATSTDSFLHLQAHESIEDLSRVHLQFSREVSRQDDEPEDMVLTGDDLDLPNEGTEDHILEGAVGGQVEDTETTQDISSDAQKETPQNGRESPEFDYKAHVPLEKQGEMQFPSETHRGHVHFVDTDVIKPTFEPQEMEEFTEEGQQGDSYMITKGYNKYTEVTHENLEELNKAFKELMRAMGSNLPDFIQSMSKSNRWFRIYINIDAGHVEDGWRLLRDRCPRARGVDFVEFVEQDGRPEYLSSATATASSGGRACTGRTGWRARILVEQYDVNGRDMSKCATLTGIVASMNSQERKEYYALTVGHAFTHEVYNIQLQLFRPGSVNTKDNNNKTFILYNLGSDYKTFLNTQNSYPSQKSQDANQNDLAIIPISIRVINDLKHQFQKENQFVCDREKGFVKGDFELNAYITREEKALYKIDQTYCVNSVNVTGSAALNSLFVNQCGAISYNDYRLIKISNQCSKGDSGLLLNESNLNQNGSSMGGNGGYKHAFICAKQKGFLCENPILSESDYLHRCNSVALVSRLDPCLEAIRCYLNVPDVTFLPVENVINSI